MRIMGGSELYHYNIIIISGGKKGLDITMYCQLLVIPESGEWDTMDF